MIIWVLTAAMFANTHINVKEIDKMIVFENVENCHIVNDLYFNGTFVCKQLSLD